MKRQYSKLSIVAALIISGLLVTCKESPIIETRRQGSVIDPRGDALYQALLKRGFSKEDIVDEGDRYLVEGDILFYKKKFDLQTSNSQGRTSQQQSEFQIGIDTQPQVTVFIDNSIPSDGSVLDWRWEIAEAVAAWNGVENCRVNIAITDNPNASIIIADGPNLPSYRCGEAESPLSNGMPGNIVRLNLDVIDLNEGTYLESDERIFVVAHELGHTLGLLHTDTYDGYHINGTPEVTWYNGNPDPGSVMNQGSCTTHWGGLSGWDRAAVQILYHEHLDDQRVFDLDIYTWANTDVMNAFSGDPIQITNHWLNTGIDEGRNSSYGFEVEYYRLKNPDVSNAYGGDDRAVLNHWICCGIIGGRQGGPAFSAPYYLQHNQDVANAYGTTNYEGALYHYLNFGIHEGRHASPDFDVLIYLDKYEDIRNAFGTNYQAATRHYLLIGRYEGRTAIP